MATEVPEFAIFAAQSNDTRPELRSVSQYAPPCAPPRVLPHSAAMAMASAGLACDYSGEHEAMEGVEQRVTAVQVAHRSTVGSECRKAGCGSAPPGRARTATAARVGA